MRNGKKVFAFIFFVASVFTSLHAITKNADIHQKVLKNGLTVFTSENHTVPLVYIEIAVKTGAVDQTPETAGLFHLYEHMMFKGNALYKDSANFQKAINDMGCTSRNGSTGPDCVNYFFTVPKDQLENGLAFWNAAIRSPNMDEKEFEGEKKVVLSEIEGDFSNPSALLGNYLRTNLFPDAPYKIDAGGSSMSVSNATLAQLMQIKNKYYIPSNSALFVGGDIDTNEVYALVEKIWGSWSNGDTVVKYDNVQQTLTPFQKTKYAVLPYDKISEELSEVMVFFRGPDSQFDLSDIYAGDYLESLLDDPNGLYATSLSSDEKLMIPDTTYVWGGSSFSRAGGMYQFGADLLMPEQNLAERAELFLDKVIDEILPAMVNDKSLFSKAKSKSIARKVKDNDIVTCQTAEGILHDVRSAWLRATPSFAKTYSDKLAKVKQSDVKNFVDKYFIEKNPLVIVFVNPSVYERTKNDYALRGYEVITPDNAFWWKQERYAYDKSKVSSDMPALVATDIFVPSKKENVYKKTSLPSVDTYKLKNGIPVYMLRNKKTQMNTVTIAVRGGIDRLSPQTSGLEKALFSFMSDSSVNYDYSTRKSLSFETQSSISSVSKAAGSYITLATIDSYLGKMLPVLVDGFISPLFDQEVYGLMMQGYRQNIQYQQSDPESILANEMTKTLYKNHTYDTKAAVTVDSIDSITIENMESHHKKLLDAQNIFVVASGNISGKKIVKELNKNLGKLSFGIDQAYVPHDVEELNLTSLNKVLTHPSAAGTGYALRLFKSPMPTGDDYCAGKVASEMYSTILYNVVREHYGACYTPYSVISISRAPVGEDFIYKISDSKNIVSYVKEASSYLERGKTIDSLNEDGTYCVNDVKDVLESYKNKLIVSAYEGQRTAFDIAGSLVYNILSYDDMFFTYKLNDGIKDVTAQKVVDVFNRYWVDAPCQWWFMVGPEQKEQVKF